MLNSIEDPVEKSAGFFCINLYTITRNKGIFGRKLSHLHTCEIYEAVVKYLAMYDCIQLFKHSYIHDSGSEN